MQSSDLNNWEPESGLDVLLMLLYAFEGDKGRTSIHGITRLDKLMFLLSQFSEFSPLFENDYDFVAYNFGPFATELLDDLEALKQQGLIEVKDRIPRSASETRDAETIDEETGELEDEYVTWDMYKYEEYHLSNIGVEIAEKIYNSATPKQREILDKVKTRFNSKSLTGLLRYVYRSFPQYATASEIRSKILGGK